MLVWLDILTPKQLFLMTEIGERLGKKGYSVLYTTRRYREIDDLVKIRDVKALVVGRYGGATLAEKLAASAHRIEQLAHIISQNKPGLSLGFASPDAARTAFGLAIPHYTINDSPHSKAVARLTLPLAERLFSPSIISKRIWTSLGAGRERIIQYKGLDPISWLKDYRPSPEVLRSLNLDGSRPIVVFRAEESFAAYLIGKAPDTPVVVPMVQDLAKSSDGKIQLVVLGRYAQQVPRIRSILPREVVVPTRAVDGPGLLSFTSLFVGAGGTMTAEAALLGVPTLSCYPGEPTLVERYLIRERLVERVCDPRRAVRRIRQILGDLDAERQSRRERAGFVVEGMEDPADVVVRYVEAAFPP